MSFFNRRQTAARLGRSSASRLAPETLSSNSSKLEPSKTAVNNLYQLDVAEATSIIPSVITYPSRLSDQSMSPVSSSSPPSRSEKIPSPATSISFPVMPSTSTSSGVPQRAKRAPTPPPPYIEHLLCQEETEAPSSAAIAMGRSRSRTSSASSWIKRVVSRSSSRASLRKQYEQIPMSEEERIQFEKAKAQRTKEALAEWNRVNDALKAAGF